MAIALSILGFRAAVAPAEAAPRHRHMDALTHEDAKELAKLLKPRFYPTRPIPVPPHGPALPLQQKSETTLGRLAVALAALGDAIVPAAQAAVPVGSEVDLNLLVIATDGNEPSYAAITSLLDSVGIIYDTLRAASYPNLQTSGCDLIPILYVGASACTTTTHARYQGIILTISTLPYCSASGCVNAFGSDAWTTLAAYEKQFGVREADFYTLPGGWRPNCLVNAACPSDSLGLVPYPSPFAARDTTASPITNATLTTAGKTVFPYVNAANPLTIKNAYTYLAKAADTTTQALLTMPDPAGGTPYVLASTYTYPSPDGRQVLALTMDNNPNLLHSLQLGYGILNWVTKGVYLGERRVSLLAQPDDLLIADDEWDTNCPSIQTLNNQGYLIPPIATAPPGYSLSQPGCTPADLADAVASGSPPPPPLDPRVTNAILAWYSTNNINPTSFTYRLTGTDFQNVVNWQTNLNNSVPNAGNVKLEWPFNGVGTTAFSPDTLTPAVISLQQNFNWVSHTYDHMTLQPNSPYPNPLSGGGFTPAIDVASIENEFFQNDSIATTTLNLQSYFSEAIVSPSISGLDYYNTMSVLGPSDFGAKFSVSDTSRPIQQAPRANTGWWNYTGTTSNAMLQIPRHPANLYYNVSVPAEWVSEYNYLYGPGGSISPDFWQLGRNIRYDEILDHESDVWVLYLLKGDRYPLMFHQTNLRAFTWNGGSFPLIGLSNGPNHTLLGDLINATLVKYNKLFKLNITSPQLYNLGVQLRRLTNLFLNRVGLTATYVQGAGTQSIRLAYTSPAATGSSATAAVSGCDPGYRPLPGPGSDLTPAPCSNSTGSLNPNTKFMNPNPAATLVFPLTGVAFGNSRQTYGGQTTSYVTVNSGQTVTVPASPAW
ncbi:MAG: hypothetical protein ACREYF_17780 [Gammaproteobacteria bacterium]